MSARENETAPVVTSNQSGEVNQTVTVYPDGRRSSTQRDERYDYVTCPRCAQRFQRIDYRGSLHALTCERPDLGFDIPRPVEDGGADDIAGTLDRISPDDDGHYPERDAAINQAVGDLEMLGVPAEALVGLYEWMSKNIQPVSGS